MISDYVQYRVEAEKNAVILDTKTIDTIERGGVLGMAVERQIREDLGLIQETFGRRMRVISPSGELVARFATN